MNMAEALVVVDMQGDFIGGSLACIHAREAVDSLASYIRKTLAAYGVEDEDEILGTFPILFTRDHHPANHSSFVPNGGTWLVHCVAGTPGGEIDPVLAPYALEELIFDKGCDPAVEQYSGFEGLNSAGQTMGEVLSLLDVDHVLVAGIATEFCVKNTCLDLVKAGFKVTLLKDFLGYVSEEGHRQTLVELSEKVDTK